MHIISFSQEVRHEVPIMFTLQTFLHRLENEEVPVALLVQVQESGLVAHPVAVVGSRPQRHQLLLEPVDVPLLHQLMCPHDQTHLVQQIELVYHLVPEDPPRSPRVASPGLDVLGVRPHEVSQGSLVGDFLFPVEQSHLVDGGQIRTEPPVDAEHISVDHSPQGQEVEGLVEVFPAVGVAVLLVDFIEKAVHHGDVAALVVAPQEVDPVGVQHFEAEEEGDGLDGVVAPVHEISDHHVLARWDSSALGKQVLDVVELPVDVSGQVAGGVDADDIGLFGHDSLDHAAELPDCRFGDGSAVHSRLVPLFDRHTQINNNQQPSLQTQITR